MQLKLFEVPRQLYFPTGSFSDTMPLSEEMIIRIIWLNKRNSYPMFLETLNSNFES